MTQNFYGIAFLDKNKIPQDWPRNTHDLAGTRLQAISVIKNGEVIEKGKIPKKMDEFIANRLGISIKDVKPTAKIVTVFKVNGYNTRILGYVVGYKGMYFWRPYNKPNERILLYHNNGKLTDLKVSKDGKRLIKKRK